MRRHVDVCLRADLARHDDHARGGHGLAGAAHLRGVGRLARRGHVALLGKLGFLLQDGVEHGVGDLVAHLVGMTLGDGFGREQVRIVRVGHRCSSFIVVGRTTLAPLAPGWCRDQRANPLPRLLINGYARATVHRPPAFMLAANTIPHRQHFVTPVRGRARGITIYRYAC